MADTGKIIAKAIVEVVGTPKEHVEEALKVVLDNIKQDEGIATTRMKVFRPKSVDNYYSAFAEIELSFDSAAVMLGFCLDYLPSSVEILSPETLTMESLDLMSLMNDLLSKLHNVNFSVSSLKAENDNLKLNAEGLLKNIVMLSIGEKGKPIDDIAKDIGIKPEDLKPFVDKYVDEGKIEVIDGNYRLKGSLY